MGHTQILWATWSSVWQKNHWGSKVSASTPVINHPAALKPRGKSKIRLGSLLSKSGSSKIKATPKHSLSGAPGPWAEGAEEVQVWLAMMNSQCSKLLLNPGKNCIKQAVWRNDGHHSRKSSLGTGSKFRPILWVSWSSLFGACNAFNFERSIKTLKIDSGKSWSEYRAATSGERNHLAFH